ncbi:MAG TPA: isoleucine--tRNA ligase [Candidatus Babeliales bacterium]|nr:isoleucine--tRNA ligase [Candidatus Babeliales bacterium]
MSEKKQSFKDTLNLPRTDFPMRPNRELKQSELLARWEEEDLYDKAYYLHEGKEKFVLHIGPPYANGPIHIGHAYNGILKDIVSKFERMSGKQVPVNPGWDCHGLPIEIKVAQENKDLPYEEFIKACRVYAQGWIDVQRKQFKDLGLVMDWKHPYITMDFKYEACVLDAFAKLIGGGYIEKKLRTVPWCASCETVLATAEIEYQDRKDPSVFVMFPMTQESKEKVLPELKDKDVGLLIWTTTPWTLPLNRAIVLKPETDYDIIKHGDKYFIAGSALTDKLCSMMEIEKNVVATVKSEELSDAKSHNPLSADVVVPTILDQMVSVEDGTACLHSAPGCGPEDYDLGIRNGLEIYSPLSSDGKYTKGIIIEELEGMRCADGQGWVMKKLLENGRLLHKKSIKHSYPHCWRCHGGLMYRATSQWFCNLAHNSLKERTLEGVKDITFSPASVGSTLGATISSRLEWCLSRQRRWGTPIPALLCKGCNYAFTSQNFVEGVAEGVAKEGVEYWHRVPMDQVAPADFACPECSGTKWEKERDILDVWFDSGTSHFAVLKTFEQLRFPADMYLEGKDQSRGWFQSSLLTSHIIEEANCTKEIVSHGFIVDGKGRKMSKSLGNVVSPEEVVKKIGIDGLRLWAISNEIGSDAVMSDELVDNVSKVFRKIRNTARFLLSNLYDFDIDKDAVAISDMQFIDRYAVAQLCITARTIENAYAQRDLTSVYHQLGDYCTGDLSALYLDIIKDRLYVEQADGKARRSAQTACWYILNTMTRLMAPVLSFTAELVSDNYQRNKRESIHLQEFANIHALWERVVDQWSGLSIAASLPGHRISDGERVEFDRSWKKHWSQLFNVRDAILKAIEAQREKGVIKHPLEARLSIHIDDENLSALLSDLGKGDQTLGAFFKELLVVSQFAVKDSSDGLAPSELSGLSVLVEPAQGTKCPRCWHYDVEKGDGDLCVRCSTIVK